MKFRLPLRAAQIGGLLPVLAVSLSAAPIVFNGTGSNAGSGNALNATASFAFTGTTLTVILTNNNAVSRPSDVLTALLWDMGNNSAVLTNYDADVTAGSTPGGQDLDNVGGNNEWRFRHNPAGLAGVTQHYGVGTAGMGIFGGGGGGQQMQWGLINGKMANANSPINSGTFIQNSATFTFTVPSGFSGTISNVRFQYGTSLTEPSILCANAAACRPPDSDTPTPEPSTFGMMGLAGASLVVAMRRRV